MNVATEDAATLLEVTVRQLEEMTDLYCKYKEEDMETTFQQILSRSTSFMSDRTAVMEKIQHRVPFFHQDTAWARDSGTFSLL